jgi:RNase P/RNase MRP subunit POP5
LLKKNRRRYLGLRIDCDSSLSSYQFLDAVWKAILTLYGEYGASRIGLTLIKYNVEEKSAIIRTVHSEVEKLRAVLATIKEIANKPAAIHVIAVSGTIKALQKKKY